VNLNIGIAGGGLMGRMLAWQLAQAGHTVSVFDKDALQEHSAAGFTAAGMLTPYAEVESADEIVFQLGKRSLDLWPEIVSKLAKPVRYQQNGSLVGAHPHDQQDLVHFKSHVVSKLKPSREQFIQLNRSGIDELEPDLNPSFNQAFYMPEEAWVSSSDFMHSAYTTAIQHGATWFENSHVTSVENRKITTTDATHVFDLAIDTRGLGAKHQWGDLRGVRGELLYLQAPEVNINRLVRMMHPRYRIYLVPTQRDDIYILGATQIESEDHSAISVRSALELLSAVYSLHTGFAEARILETKTNCRPALANNQPKIEVHDGLIRINGLFRHGYLLAPAIAEQVMNWLRQGSDQPSSDYPHLFDIAV